MDFFGNEVDLALDENFDIVFLTDGDIASVSKEELCLQEIKQWMAMSVGGLFYSPNKGSNLFYYIKNSYVSGAEIKKEIKNILSENPKVDSDSIQIEENLGVYEASFSFKNGNHKLKLNIDLEKQGVTNVE